MSANQATYLGTIYTSAAGQVSWTYGTSTSNCGAALFGVWNAYNRKTVGTTVQDSTVNWNYNTSTYREAHGSTTCIAQAVFGLTEDTSIGQYNCMGQPLSGASAGGCGVTADSTTATPTISSYLNNSATVVYFNSPMFVGVLGSGYHYLTMMEIGSTSGSGVTYFGASGGANGISGGVFQFVM